MRSQTRTEPAAELLGMVSARWRMPPRVGSMREVGVIGAQCGFSAEEVASAVVELLVDGRLVLWRPDDLTVLQVPNVNGRLL